VVEGGGGGGVGGGVWGWVGVSIPTPSFTWTTPNAKVTSVDGLCDVGKKITPVVFFYFVGV